VGHENGELVHQKLTVYRFEHGARKRFLPGETVVHHCAEALAFLFQILAFALWNRFVISL